MTGKEVGPRRWLPDRAPKTIHNGYRNSSARHRQPARCELHGVHLVHRFPPRCPLSGANPLEIIERLQDAASRVIGRGFHDPELCDALGVLVGKNTCLRCLDRILTHPAVRRLRAWKVAAA